LEEVSVFNVFGDLGKEGVRFSMSGVVCLSESDDGWSTGWAHVPQLVGKMGKPGNCYT